MKIFKRIKAEIAGETTKIGLRETARFGLWVANNGWHPTLTLCPQDGNMVYEHEGMFRCTGELLALWRHELTLIELLGKALQHDTPAREALSLMAEQGDVDAQKLLVDNGLIAA